MAVNYSAYDNVSVTDPSAYFLDPLLPADITSKALLISITWINFFICGVFVVLVFLLTLVQARNFCMNKTTSERFAKAKTSTSQARTSSFLSEAGGDDEEDDHALGQSIIDAMHTRDHAHKACSWAFNCWDMCCLNEQPDQNKIYQI